MIRLVDVLVAILSGDVSGGWSDRLDKQKAYENTAEMDEGKAEATADLQSCRPSQAFPVHHMVYKTQGHATKTWKY